MSEKSTAATLLREDLTRLVEEIVQHKRDNASLKAESARLREQRDKDRRTIEQQVGSHYHGR